MTAEDSQPAAEAADLADPDAEFYGWHADWGHAPQWDADGPHCQTCGEVARPPDRQLATEAEPESEPELEAG